MPQVNYGLHWFRRDLRIVGNPALLASTEHHNGNVLGVFFFDAKFLARSDFSHKRFGFFLKTLQALRRELLILGGDLLVLDAAPIEGFTRIFAKLRQMQVPLPKSCSLNRDYEPYARARD